MKTLKLIIGGFFSIVISSTAFSQTKKTIDSLENYEQNCLDKGEDMLSCAREFYFQMDSILNILYFKFRSTLDSLKRVEFKKEEKLWLVKRDRYFKKTLKEFREKNPNNSPYGLAFGAQDDVMFMYQDNAAFVRERVLTLLRRLNK